MPDQRLPQSARNRLSPGQVYCLAWAARPGTSRPPLEHFGVPKNGWAGGYIVTPRTSRATWISLRARGLVQIRAEAAEHGWTVKRHAHGLDLCPQCTKDGWGPADELCPKCRCATLTAPWWDDLPDNGGQVVGTLHTCTNRMCDWFDSR